MRSLEYIENENDTMDNLEYTGNHKTMIALYEAVWDRPDKIFHHSDTGQHSTNGCLVINNTIFITDKRNGIILVLNHKTLEWELAHDLENIRRNGKS
jgi:hypothetical protein